MEKKLIKSEIEARIFTIRGMQVMLDSDLAELYGTETKFVNRAVNRNLHRFPTDFAFRLSKEEFESLRFQIGTSKNPRGGRRYLPFVFTEQGVSMLSAVLNTTIAVNISIQIIRAFVELRKSHSELNLIFNRIAQLEIKQEISETKLNKVLNALEGENNPSSGIFSTTKSSTLMSFLASLFQKLKSQSFSLITTSMKPLSFSFQKETKK